METKSTEEKKRRQPAEEREQIITAYRASGKPPQEYTIESGVWLGSFNDVAEPDNKYNGLTLYGWPKGGKLGLSPIWLPK